MGKDSKYKLNQDLSGLVGEDEVILSTAGMDTINPQAVEKNINTNNDNDFISPINANEQTFNLPGDEQNIIENQSVNQQLEELQNKLAEMQDALLRAKAETENVRKRAQDDIVKAHKFAVEKFAKEMLAVCDSLEAALAIPDQSAEKLTEGVSLTLKQLTAGFDKFELFAVEPLQQKFDPNFHQAIGMVDSDLPANTVVSVLQKGYTLSGRVLRAAMVTVAKPASN